MVNFDPRTIQYLKQEIKNFKLHSKEVRKKSQMESVHKLRVAIRRIRSVLNLAGIKLKSLKRLNKKLGQVRDLDIAIKNAEHYHLNPAKLESEREKRGKKLRSLLTKEHRQEIQRGLESILNKLEAHPDIKVELSLSPLISELSQWKKNISLNSLHELRISLKKVRYIFEASHKDVGYLKKAQDQLGSVHDLEVLSEYFTENSKIQSDIKVKSKKAQVMVMPVVKRALLELKKI